jgi:hypothetical protein
VLRDEQVVIHKAAPGILAIPAAIRTDVEKLRGDPEEAAERVLELVNKD